MPSAPRGRCRSRASGPPTAGGLAAAARERARARGYGRSARESHTTPFIGLRARHPTTNGYNNVRRGRMDSRNSGRAVRESATGRPGAAAVSGRGVSPAQLAASAGTVVSRLLGEPTPTGEGFTPLTRASRMLVLPGRRGSVDGDLRSVSGTPAQTPSSRRPVSFCTRLHPTVGGPRPACRPPVPHTSPPRHPLNVRSSLTLGRASCSGPCSTCHRPPPSTWGSHASPASSACAPSPGRSPPPSCAATRPAQSGRQKSKSIARGDPVLGLCLSVRLERHLPQEPDPHRRLETARRDLPSELGNCQTPPCSRAAS